MRASPRNVCSVHHQTLYRRVYRFFETLKPISLKSGNGHTLGKILFQVIEKNGSSQLVNLVKDRKARFRQNSQLVQYFPDGYHLLLIIWMTDIDDVQQEIRLNGLFKGALE